MCGIAGFTGKKNLKLLNKMLANIRHRGPDEKVIFGDDVINAGMNRLAIIDLHKGLYPFTYKHYVLFYNGEIYNFSELKNQLKRRGIKFKTNSDAEVILPLFDQYGPRAFSLLEGMFAIFIYDKKNKKIYLARDKMGEKPLYFFHQEDFFAFASELKALLAISKRQSTTNNQHLIEYLHQSYVSAPHTLIKNVRKIPPAHYLAYDLKQNKYSVRAYFTLATNQQQPRKENLLVKQLDGLIKESVKARLMADVPVGCFLSGGLDSSLITYFAAQVKKNMHTFSVIFPGFEKFDESGQAKLAAEICGTKHNEVSCTAKKIRSIIENIGQIIDEPIIDAAVLPLYLLAKQARKKVKVVLTGEGADELFGGYDRYQFELKLAHIQNLLKPIPHVGKLIKTLFPGRFKRLTTNLKNHYASDKLWPKDKLKLLLINPKNDNPLYYGSQAKLSKLKNNPLRYMQEFDLNGFLSERLLMKVDKVTMFHSLEARCPYLDSKIVEFALNLPVNLKINGSDGKYILKKVAEKYLPKEIVWRKKHSFNVPLGFWFRNELKDIVYDSIKNIKEFYSLFNYQYYQHIIAQHMGGKRNYADQIWGMIVLTKFMKYHQIL